MAPGPANLIRTKLDDGVLPREFPAKIYAGYGAGAPCSACDDLILHVQVQYEFPVNDETFRFHLGCFGLWEAECRRRGWRREECLDL